MAVGATRRIGETTVLLIAALMMDAGVVFAIATDVGKVRRARESLTWPSVPGVVLSSRYVPRGGYRANRPCQADIVYRYEVYGRSYTSNQYSHGSFACGELKSKANAHFPGSDVRVHYDPNDPQSAILEPVARGVSWLLVALLVLLVVPFSLLLVIAALPIEWFLRDSRSRQERRQSDRQRQRNREKRARAKNLSNRS